MVRGTLIVAIDYSVMVAPEPTTRGSTRCTIREVSVDETNQQAKVRGTKQCPRYCVMSQDIGNSRTYNL